MRWAGEVAGMAFVGISQKPREGKIARFDPEKERIVL